MIDNEMYTYTPQGSLWMEEPTFWRGTPAAEWDKAVKILDHLMPLGECINQALVIALGDASTRAREELKRADEREGSERDEHGLSPDEDGRLTGLISRCDELVNVETMIEDHVPDNVRGRASTLAMLKRLHDEMHDEYEHYRRELELED